MKRSKVIAFAAGFAGLMPMATDIYLIVMPAIAQDFGASLAATHASMAAFALGFGVAHLYTGVLADRYGRRPVAIWGALLFMASTVAVTWAPTLGVLTACRFVQGLFIATCPIIARAIVRDAIPAHLTANAYSLVNALSALAPLTAPFIGAAAAAWGGWRAAMAVLIVYGVVLLAAVLIGLPETRPQSAPGEEPRSPLAAAREVLTDRRFLMGASMSMLLYSALFTWISTSPFLMMDQLGFSRVDAGIVLGFGSLGYMGASLASARLASRYRPERLVALGAPLMLAGAIGCLVALSREAPGPIGTVLMAFPFYIGLGFAHANSIQMVMRPFPHIAGQASAWLGLLQQVAGVTVSVIAVRIGAGFAAIGVMIACCAALVLVSALVPRHLAAAGEIR
jgi:DHA1 family bicyclomycin/chloramphenicol resistance-like MFS transporter